MWSICKEYAFEAAHWLPEHDGKCARMHGHNYKVEIEVQSHIINLAGPKRGMIIDFGDLDAIVKPIIERLDHYTLNDVLSPSGAEYEPPTAEILAEWLFREISDELSDILTGVGTLHQTPPQLKRVRVWETPKAWAEFRQ